MIKIKPIVFSACAAFVLSFVIAIASKSGFPVSLLKATIFGLLFGAIAVGVQFVYAKFLADGTAAPAEAAEEPKVAGSKVDLVVSEEDLPDDKESPAFYVEGKHVLSSDDVGKPFGRPAAAAGTASNSAAPDVAFGAAEQNEALEAAEQVREQKAAENITQKAAEIQAKSREPEDVPAPQAAKSAESPAPQASEPQPAFAPINLAAGGAAASSGLAGGGDELDDLPDIGEIGGGSSAEGQDEDVIEDSEFAEEGMVHPRRQTELSDGKVADVKDAPVMAEAIRTILKKEE